MRYCEKCNTILRSSFYNCSCGGPIIKNSRENKLNLKGQPSNESTKNNIDLKPQTEKELVSDDEWIGPLTQICKYCSATKIYYKVYIPSRADQPSFFKFKCFNCNRGIASNFLEGKL